MSSSLSHAYFYNTSDTVKSVSAVYDALAQEEPGIFVNRIPVNSQDGCQQNLSVTIADSLHLDTPIISEAPTGTGKTLAYLIGAIIAMRQAGVPNLVVSTATIALQNQVIHNELPRLAKIGFIPKNSYTLAKGRQRYFCPLAAQHFLDNADGSGQMDMFDQEVAVSQTTVAVVSDIMARFNAREWNGDTDEVTLPANANIKPVCSSVDTCITRKCDYYEDGCPFFDARRRMANSDIVVANHDLVLSDLEMSLADPDHALFPFEKYIVVFDEAHQLPDKAISRGEHTANFGEISKVMVAAEDCGKSLFSSVELSRELRKKGWDSSIFEFNAQSQAIMDATRILDQIVVDPLTLQKRYPGGLVDPSVTRCLAPLRVGLEDMLAFLTQVSEFLKKMKVASGNKSVGPAIQQNLFQLSYVRSKLSSFIKGVTSFISDIPKVRWIFHSINELSVRSSPLEGRDVLRDLLWGTKGRVLPAFISATLRDAPFTDSRGYSRFSYKIALDTSEAVVHPNYYTLPSIFPYAESKLVIAKMRHAPKEKEFKQELGAGILSNLGAIDGTLLNEGTLILFTSVVLMRAIATFLRKNLGPDLVLVQGDMPHNELISTHKNRINSNSPSILCGTQTMAEGLDLPGIYCTHVIITRLPFPVPTTPVEVERQEKYGNTYFPKHQLPDTIVKFVQMIGRLLRRESDRGRITIFDKRLGTTVYGKKIIEVLPPFKVENLN